MFRPVFSALQFGFFGKSFAQRKKWPENRKRASLLRGSLSPASDGKSFMINKQDIVLLITRCANAIDCCSFLLLIRERRQRLLPLSEFVHSILLPPAHNIKRSRQVRPIGPDVLPLKCRVFPCSILALCCLFESLVQLRHPRAFLHSIRCGAQVFVLALYEIGKIFSFSKPFCQPLSLVFPWMFTCFAGVLDVRL